MSGYIRQSVADIINGANITAPPLNAEFNQLASAFNGSTGHTHTGAAGEAPPIALATSVSGFLPAIHGGVGGRNNNTAVTDPTNLSDANAGFAAGSLFVNIATGRVFINLNNTPNAAVWAESMGILNGSFTPQLTNTVDIGTSTFKFKNAFLSGALSSASISTSTAAVDNLSVSTSATFTATPVFNGGITVNGAATISGTLTANGNTQIGDATSDTVNIVARVASSIVPSTTNTRDLGADTLRFRNLFLAGSATIASLSAASATITGGTINGTVIGNVTPSAITGTLVTASTGFSGPLTGHVTGNLTGNVTGNLTGAVTGNVTGDVTSAGTSTFTNLTVNGSLNLNADTAGTVTGLSAPINPTDAATKLYVDTSVSALIDAAPGALDTLNELSAALNDDPNFATTVAAEIATKVSKAGDTMTGPLAMSNQKITALGAPVVGADATNKTYVDAQTALKLNLAGGTMSGVLAMGNNRITGLQDPTNAQDAVTKSFIENLFGSTASAAASAAAASVSETNAAASAASAAQSFASFDDRYLGEKAAAPTVDNQGDPLVTGALYFDSVLNELRVFNGTSFQSGVTDISLLALRTGDTLTNTTLDNVTVNSGSIDNSPVGATTASTGAFTTLSSTSTTALNGTTIPADSTLVKTTDKLSVMAVTTPTELASVISGVTGSGDLVFGTSPTIETATLNTPTINTPSVSGGTINDTSIGASTPSTGAFTNFTASGTASFTSTEAVKLPVGTEAQRPTPAAGMLRFNDDSDEFEGYNGTAWASVGGSAITNDTTTSTDVFPLFADATTGTAANVFTSDDKLLYKPSTGEFKSQALVATNGIVVNSATINQDYTIATGENGHSVGPLVVNAVVTMSAGSVWQIS